MAPTEPLEAIDEHSSSARVFRVLVYVVVLVALGVVVWALMDGGERDLWSSPSALLVPRVLARTP